MSRRCVFCLITAAFLSLISCVPQGTRPPASPTSASLSYSAREFTYSIVNRYPHDTEAFTEGFEYKDGYFYEGTGLVGKSSIRRVELTSGTVIQEADLPAPYFGEGVTIMDSSLYQLTWQSRTGFIYDPGTFEQRGNFTYASEGWGLTNDGKRLIMSDGTRTIYFRSPRTLQVSGTMLVTGGPPANPEMRLNELEFVRGEIYANVWPTNYLVMINPDSGKVTGWADLSTIVPQTPTNLAELNGIAYDSETGQALHHGQVLAGGVRVKTHAEELSLVASEGTKKTELPLTFRSETRYNLAELGRIHSVSLQFLAVRSLKPGGIWLRVRVPRLAGAVSWHS